MSDEKATPKRTDGESDTVETGAKKRPTYAADNAVAVNAADLHALVEHARNTGAEDLAAKFQI
jgi:hypothetical protein